MSDAARSILIATLPYSRPRMGPAGAAVAGTSLRLVPRCGDLSRVRTLQCEMCVGMWCNTCGSMSSSILNISPHCAATRPGRLSLAWPCEEPLCLPVSRPGRCRARRKNRLLRAGEWSETRTAGRRRLRTPCLAAASCFPRFPEGCKGVGPRHLGERTRLSPCKE